MQAPAEEQFEAFYIGSRRCCVVQLEMKLGKLTGERPKIP